jgi:NADH-quinone oxidoreductase subunit N
MTPDLVFDGPDVQWFHLSPILVLVGGALLLLVVGAMTPRWPRGLYAIVTALVAAAAGGLAMFLWDDVTDEGTSTLVAGALAFDTVSDGPEIYAVFLLAATGGVVMGSANDLIVLFLGLETLSLALYVLASSDRERTTSQESGIKYFVLGSFASALFLYGIALVYGGTQSTNISEIVASFRDSVTIDGQHPLVLAGLALMLVGLGFKVAAVPFHSWAPDVYHGAPTNVTAFMASVGKAAAFAAMLRVLVVALPFHRDDWRPVIWALAVLTLVIGSALAVVQTDVKRMLAYSSISHAGFILVGVEAAGHRAGGLEPGDGVPSVLTYLLVYAVLTVGSFAVVALVGWQSGGDTSLDAFRGLARTHPSVALALTVLLLAQAGVPFTSGFVAKWGVIQAAVEERSYAIGIIAMLAAVIAAYLYLRIMVSMWLQEGEHAGAAAGVPIATGLAVLAAVVFTVVVGVWPDWLLGATETATQVAR